MTSDWPPTVVGSLQHTSAFMPFMSNMNPDDLDHAHAHRGQKRFEEWCTLYILRQMGIAEFRVVLEKVFREDLKLMPCAGGLQLQQDYFLGHFRFSLHGAPGRADDDVVMSSQRRTLSCVLSSNGPNVFSLISRD